MYLPLPGVSGFILKWNTTYAPTCPHLKLLNTSGAAVAECDFVYV